MSGSSTPNFGFALPAIGGAQNVWGGQLNSNFVALDTLLEAFNTAGGAFMPLTGGTINGNMQVSGQLSAANLTVSSLTSTGNLAVANAANFAAGQVSDFQVYLNSPQRVWQWASGSTDTFDTQNGVRYWANNGVVMQLEWGGDFTITGNGWKPGGGPWAAASDERVKQNIRPYESGLAEIRRLVPIAFEYNGEGDTKADGATYHGLSAQRTLSVMPELVFRLATISSSTKLLPDQLATDLGPLTLALCNAVR